MNDHHAELRALVDDIATRDSTRLWDTVVELGLHTIGVPESAGGSGGDLADLVTVVNRLARRAASAPIAEHAVTAWALTHAGRPLPAGGLLTIASGGHDPLATVPWGRDAVGVIVLGPDDVVRHADLIGRRAVVREGVNLAGEPRDALDSSTVALPGAPPAAAIRARIALLRAAAVAGACTGAYELTRTHVTRRRQFGKPLIDIPAVATALATMKVTGLQVDAAVARATDLHRGTADPGTLLAASAVARVVAATTADTVARIAHQLHGAMGVTREYALHPLTTRLWAWRDEGGDEETWARHLGARTIEGGERDLWQRLAD